MADFGDLSAAHLLDALDGVAWLTDRAGIIIAVGRRNWAQFAADNGAPSLTANSVLGNSLFVTIDGDQVRAEYRRLHDRVVSGEREQGVLAYRCDSPIAERHMRMSLSGVRAGDRVEAVLYQSQIIEEKIRAPLPLFDRRSGVMDKSAARASMCAFCQRLQWPLGEGAGRRWWVGAVDYYRLGGPEDVAIESVVCPRCRRRIQQQTADI